MAIYDPMVIPGRPGRGRVVVERSYLNSCRTVIVASYYYGPGPESSSLEEALRLATEFATDCNVNEAPVDRP